MYRSIFARTGAAAARSFSTRATATARPTKYVVGATVAASIMFSFSPVFNDTNKDKQKKATKDTEPKSEDKAAEPEKSNSGAEGTESEQTTESEDGDHGSAAFNPETGEINWDCPCLGGMAHGPCGEEFKEAFACFVYLETEPKGIDCITKFEAMRTCFKQHPEHYKEELYEDDEPVPDVAEVEVAEVRVAEVGEPEVIVAELDGPEMIVAEVDVPEIVEIDVVVPEKKKSFDEKFNVEAEDETEPGVIEVVTADLA